MHLKRLRRDAKDGVVGQNVDMRLLEVLLRTHLPQGLVVIQKVRVRAAVLEENRDCGTFILILVLEELAREATDLLYGSLAMLQASVLEESSNLCIAGQCVHVTGRRTRMHVTGLVGVRVTGQRVHVTGRRTRVLPGSACM